MRAAILKCAGLAARAWLAARDHAFFSHGHDFLLLRTETVVSCYRDISHRDRSDMLLFLAYREVSFYLRVAICFGRRLLREQYACIK